MTSPWPLPSRFFFFNDTATTEIYTLSLHDALPIVLVLAVRRRMGLEGLFSAKQQHDLGKLCFGFSVFWAYLMWSQFLGIWYGNLPEETFFIFYRLFGPWKPIGGAAFLLVFVLPVG